MNRHDELLDRLAAQARRHEEPAGEMSPHLPTRVLALLRNPPATASLWECFTLRAVPVAALALVICAVLAPRATPPADHSADALANDIFSDLLTP